MNVAYLLAIITTTVEMTICLVCARQVWRLRTGANDPSRRLLAMGSLVSGLLAAFALAGSVGPSGASAPQLMLQPWIGLIYMSMHIVMTLYPITVVRPDWLNPRRYFFLFLPVALFALAFLFFAGRWTPLPTPHSVWENAGRTDVLLRLASQFAMFPYCLILFVLPYNKHQSSASFWWILNYSMGLAAICGVHIALMLTYHPALLVLLPLLAAALFLLSMEYERDYRLRPEPIASDSPTNAPLGPDAGIVALDTGEVAHPSGDIDPAAGEVDPAAGEVDPAAGHPEGVPEDLPEFGLWTRVEHVLDQEEAWRDPDLTLISLARRCGTNVTYLNRILRQETGSGFKDLIKSKRIACVEAQLREAPSVDIQTAFFNAGYRSRATAWRNFKDVLGVTPTEFRQSLGK